MKRNIARGIAAAALSLSLAAANLAHAQTPPGLGDLIGARGSSAEAEMSARGYQFTRNLGSAALWWHPGKGACASVAVDNGRVASIQKASPSDCGKSASAPPAATAKTGHNANWNRGCSDARVGSYDRAHRNADYEAGWQSCKTAAPKAPAHNSTWNRGCADAKAGSYDRAHHNADYEAGWQACKKS
jgi:hypothetical protein